MEAGVLPHCYFAFMHTESGSKFVEQHAKMVWLQKGEVAWIPYGYVCHAFTYECEEQSSKKRPSGQSWTPWLCASQASSALEPQALLQVARMTVKDLKSQKGVKWEDRCNLMVDFFVECGVDKGAMTAVGEESG